LLDGTPSRPNYRIGPDLIGRRSPAASRRIVRPEMSDAASISITRGIGGE